jgi:hypothetical protein
MKVGSVLHHIPDAYELPAHIIIKCLKADPEVKMLLDKCPHCNTRHIEAKDYHTVALTNNEMDGFWTTVRCQNPLCLKLILVMQNSDKSILGIYPPGSYELDSTIVKDSELREDFREAGLCLSAGCFKASMVMSRRVLQRCLKAQGYTDYKLAAAIDHAMKDGTLRKPFHEIATEIREYGNFGAHPDDDQLNNIGKDEASLILDFSQLLIEEFYEIPAAAQKLRKNRQQTEKGVDNPMVENI